MGTHTEYNNFIMTELFSIKFSTLSKKKVTKRVEVSLLLRGLIIHNSKNVLGHSEINDVT